MKEALYTFNWISGGYNQVYARNKREALKKIAASFFRTGLRPDLKTFRRLDSDKEVAAYYRSIAD